MNKKTKMRHYCTLSDIDHKMQFINTVAVITSITPMIKRVKLTQVVLEVSDRTMHNPGFVVKLRLDSEILSEFLVVAKTGLIVAFQEIKVIKNEGVVYGEVREEEELKLYSEKGSCIQWYSDEELNGVSDQLKCSIKDVSQWKKTHLKEMVSTEDMKDDLRRSRLSNPQSNNTPKNSPGKKCTDLKNQNSNIIKSQKRSSTNTKHSPVSNHSKAANSNDNSIKVFQSPTRKSSVNNIKGLSQFNVHANKQLNKGNNIIVSSVNNTSGSFGKNYDNVSPKQQKSSKENLKSTISVMDNKLSPNSLSPTSKSSEEITISRDSTDKRVSARSCNNPKAKEDIKSLPRLSRKDHLIKEEKKREIEKSSPFLRNNVNDRKRTLEFENITEFSKKSRTDSGSHSNESCSDKSLKNKGSPISRSMLTTMKNSEKDSNGRPHRSGQNISPNSINKVMKDQNHLPESDTISNKCDNMSGSKDSHGNTGKKLAEHPYTQDRSELERDASINSSQDSNYPIKKLVKNIQNLKKKSQSFKTGINISERSDLKTPALNSSDSSISNSGRSQDHSPAVKTVKQGTQQIPFPSSRNDDVISLDQVDPNVTEQSPGKKKKENPSEESAEISTKISEEQRHLKHKNVVQLKNGDNENNITEKQISNIGAIDSSFVNNSPSNRSIALEDKRKLTRNSLPKTNGSSSSPVDKFEKSNPIYFYLKSITRKVNIKQVDTLSDISMCDLEEIDVPDKFDLECKVISVLTLIEDNIQIVRVQDGSICKKALIFPEASSWEGIIEKILNNPIVMENSPFVDIVIFDYTRMDQRLKVGNFYRFRNVMSIKFCLKYDPRIDADKRGELFFCVKGQNAYINCLRSRTVDEIKTKLEEDTYKSIWNKTFVDHKAVEKSLLPTPPSAMEIGNDKLISSPEKSIGKHNPDETQSPNTRKRKSTDSETGKEDETFKTPTKNNKLDQDSTEKNIDPYKSKLIDSTASSDETALGETPALLRELREIMHEESVIGLPLTSSEDIHLKNTGSEVTYSQFHRGADEKMLNFRTSTQADVSESVAINSCEESAQMEDSRTSTQADVSESVAINRCEESAQMEDSSKMEPLVYCASGSSKSSTHTVPLKCIKVPENFKCQEECSESILHHCKAGNSSEVKTNHTQLEIGIETHNEEKRNDDASDISYSSSVRVISSNSSELECEIVHNDKCPTERQAQLESPFKQKFMSFGQNNSSKYDTGRIEVVSDNSSNNSLFSIGNNRTAIKQSKSCDMPANQSNSSTIVHDLGLDEQQPDRVVELNIPDSVFFKSSVKQDLVKEDETNIVDENDSIKYFSCSVDQSLPFIDLAILNKLIDQNYFKLSVFIVSITPSLTGSWREKCIKARCPNCDKLFDVYNAANNKYNENATSTAALSVGSHIVCPDSQCCNQILERPEFQISVEMKLRDGTPLTALIAAQHAEQVLGCTAQDAVKDEKQLDKVAAVLKNLERKISSEHLTQLHFTRENICDPKSGPLYIQKIYA